jgi:undecaprenyl-diphosphatase
VDLIQAIILGIIQGLTEFLPISSTAHLRVFPSLVGWNDPGAAFTAVIQLGTLLAVLIHFGPDLWKAIRAWVRSFYDDEAAKSQDARMGWAIFVGTLPIVILGFIFKSDIKGESLRSLYVVAWALIVMAILLALADNLATHKRKVEDARPKDGLIIGIWQAVALIPGASRSGSTITGALFRGFDRAAAARFSFLLSVPSILAAGILGLVEERKAILGQNLVPTAAATIAAFIVGYWSIGFLIKFLQNHRTTVFVIYRLALGLILLILLQTGWLKPNQGIPPHEEPSAAQNR